MCSTDAEISDRLATIGMGREVGRPGAAVPLSVDGAGSPSNTMSPWPRPTSVPSYIVIHPAAVWSQYRPMGQKVGAASVLETVSPSNTMWPGPRPVPSGIVIHPAVWPQYTNVTRHIDIDRHRSDGILANRSTNGRPKMKQ